MGRSLALSGRAEDSAKADGQLLFNFTARDGGEDLSIFIDLEGLFFQRGYLFQPGMEGEYDPDVFLGGPSDVSLQHLGAYAVSVVAGSALVSVPIDFFSGLVLDQPLAAELPLERDIWIEGSTATLSGV